MSNRNLALVLVTIVIGLVLTGGGGTGGTVVVAAKPTPTPPPGPATPIQIYGAWHCGNHYCDWSLVRDLAEFDQANHWLIDRGDGRPSVNLVVLSFVHPLRLLEQGDTGLFNMIPAGMTQDVVNYFKSRGVRVMLSIGGITYTDAWDAALAANPTQLGLNAAEVAQTMGVGIEIDYERTTDPNLAGLQAFVDAYRSMLPYDATGVNHAARLTIDLGAGDRWLTAITRYATANWLDPSNPVLDYANAMVAGTLVRHAYRLAGARRRQAELRSSCSTTGAGEVHRRSVPEGQHRQLQQLRLLPTEGVRHLCPDGSASRRGDDGRHARLHVLGGGVPVGATELHRHSAAQHLRGRYGRRRHHVRHRHPHAGFAAGVALRAHGRARAMRGPRRPSGIVA